MTLARLRLCLLLIICGGVASPSWAQPAPVFGYDLLVKAAQLVVLGDNGGPISKDFALAAAENLRRQRVGVERNARALVLLREALKHPIRVPPERNSSLATADLSRFRQAARQLQQESEVALADGNFDLALDSRLLCLEFGAALTRGGPQTDSQVGAAIENVARQDFEAVAAKLDAAQLRQALIRLRAIDARRAPIGEVMEVEKKVAIQTALPGLRAILDAESERKRLGRPETAPTLDLNPAQVREMLALTPETLAEQISAVFYAIIARDKLSYPRARQIEIPPAPTQFVRFVTDGPRDSIARFAFERNLVQNRLLEGALELRAIKLETGGYPTAFQAPIDPFSDYKPLIYRRDGEKYVLYSIGPDGQNDGGEAIESTVTNQKISLMSQLNRFAPESSGDILAPIL